MNIACGTVENDEGSLLLSEVRAGTHFRLAHKCPKCKGYFRAEFGLDETTGSMLIYEKGQGEAHAAETATYSCGASGCILSEDDRQEAIAGGELIGKDQEYVKGKGIVGPINETKASLITHALDCTRGSLPVIARDHYLAQKAIDEDDDHSAMRMYYRYVMCAEYNKDTDADLEGLSVHLTRAELHRKSKASNYAVGEVPEGFTYCLLSIDVQHSRCYYVLSAFSDLQCADVDYGYEMFCKHGEMPTKLEKFQGLDRAIEKGLETCQNNEVDLIAIPLDVGDKQEELEEYIKWSAFGDMIYPIKGIGDEQAKSMGRGKVVAKAKNDVPGVYFLRRQPAGWTLTLVDTDAVRHKVQDSYRLKADKPGANLLPQGIEVQDYFFKHLTDAKWLRKPNGKMGWQQPKRVDFLDCKIYMAAVNYRIKVKMKAAGGLNDLDVPAPNDSDAPQEKPQPKIDKNISPKKAAYHF